MSLPCRLFGLTDAAYTLKENKLILYIGANQCNPVHDEFDFYLSQLCIFVEMAFGRMVNKFWILSSKIGGRIDRVSAILTACTWLHNFIKRVCEDIKFKVEHLPLQMSGMCITLNSDALLGMLFLPFVPDDECGAFPRVSHMREAIVEYICEHDIRRPLHNLHDKG